MNQSEHGVIATSLKVYEWFDTDEMQHAIESQPAKLGNCHRIAQSNNKVELLSKEQFDEQRGRVAMKSDVLRDNDIFIE